MDIYRRLYRYREGPSFSPLENFLTEGLADLFNRLPTDLRIAFLVGLLPSSSSERLRDKCKDGKRIEAMTQVSILALDSLKRPDMLVYLDDKPLVLVEIKVDAPLQKHSTKSLAQERSTKLAKEAAQFQNQLKSYSDWMGSQCAGKWPGAVVFLTHGTSPPEGFEDEAREGKSVVRCTRTWREVANWLCNNLDLARSDTVFCALATDFNSFLEEEGLMTDFINARDLAAAALFMPSYQALNHTISTAISAVATKYPKSKGGNVHLDFWSEGNIYWGWYYLNKQLNPSGTKFYIGIGICFPDQTFRESENFASLPKHEPFFFVFLADDWENESVTKLLSKVPKGWQGLYDNFDVIITRPVSQFDANPDVRAQALVDWVLVEVGRAMACIPNYEAATPQKIKEATED